MAFNHCDHCTNPLLIDQILALSMHLTRLLHTIKHIPLSTVYNVKYYHGILLPEEVRRN